jgi:preprotein translocase subunit SecA
LFGRAARQGDPGSAVAFVSAGDELLCRFAPSWSLRLFRWSLRRSWPAVNLLGRIISGVVQNRAQGQAFHSRKAVMKMDVWLEEATSFSGSIGH